MPLPPNRRWVTCAREPVPPHRGRERGGGARGVVTMDDVLTLLAEEFSMVETLLERESPHRAV